MTGAAWYPDSTTCERAQITRFLRQCGCGSFDELQARSILDISWFTEQVLRFLALEWERPYERVVDLSMGPQWAKWCVGGRLNIAANCLRHDSQRPAVVWEGEEGEQRVLSYRDLRLEVERAVRGLRALGLHRGDAVGIHLPMLPETVVVLLACAAAGMVAVPLFSGYGPGAIESRLRDVNAKLLFTCDAFPRRGKSVPALEAAREAAARCPGLQQVIVIPRAGEATAANWREFMEGAGDARFETMDSEDPLLVLYTSGTTGRPKGILHSQVSFPIKAAQDMALGTDVGAGTRIAWITDLGWMMGPWLIYGALLLGGTVCLYDGAPDYPDAGRLWKFCATHHIEVLGISPTLVRALLVHGAEYPRQHDLSSLRVFGSTGEPWNPDPWWWLFDTVGRGRLPIVNYSGGTEISGGILMGSPRLPVKPCSFAAPCPGMDVAVVDEHGNAVAADTVGELAIRQPWIGMARGFLNDPARYLATYWSRVPGMWIHGDWAKVDADGHWYILGRSDDTVKVAGKRVGPAEIESLLVSHDAVAEAAAIGIPHESKGNCVVAFCVLAHGREPGEALERELGDLVAKELGKPLRPDRIVFVPAVPKTRNAKVMRRVIRAAYLGEDPGDLTALDNPGAVDAIRAAAS